MSKLYLYAAAALLIAGAFGGIYYKGRIDEREALEFKQRASLAASQAAWQAKLNAAATRTAELEAQLATESRQLSGRVRHLESDLAAALRADRGRVHINTCRDVPATAGAATEPTDTAERDEQAGRDAAAFARDASDYAGRCEQDRLTVLACNEYARLIEQWRAE